MEKSREANTEEQHIHTAVFAIIVGVLMACLERAVVVSLVEQWRARIFLLLNLILLSVLFTSLRFSGSKKANALEEGEKKNASEERKNNKVEVICEEQEEGLMEVELSEEELNQRVEAFIAMFRQHLVSDSRRKNRVSAAKISTSVK